MHTKTVTAMFLSTLLIATLVAGMAPADDAGRIRPYEGNPYFWQYKGEPVLLLGGSWQDNLFNHPVGLEEHLDLLVSVGGNYVRNVMSHRNEGNVFAYAQNADGLYDLDTFNDEYWRRFAHFLDLTYERDIIVQIEIWATWDLYVDHQSLGGWSKQPFNPANTVTYTSEESGLPTVIDISPGANPTDHPFFHTVPALDNNELVLRYQTAFVDKILSYALDYPHVLYCMNNETGERVEWSDFWAQYVRDRAAEAGKLVETAEMRRNSNITASDHRHMMDAPELYTFLDISQNNALRGVTHRNRIQQVRSMIADHPRPLNNTKIYGFDPDTNVPIRRWWQNVLGGCASVRFHRPHPLESPDDHERHTSVGLGLSPLAQEQIRSTRVVMDAIGWPDIEPDLSFVSLATDPSYAVTTDKTHLVYTRAQDGTARLYMNGEAVEQGTIGGDLASWNAGMRLALASELTGERPWLGVFHDIAVYDRALTAEEVAAHTAAGAPEQQDGLQARYAFDEGDGTIIRDISGITPALDLRIQDPDAVAWTDDGLDVRRMVLIATPDPAERLTEAMQASNAFTMEAWITPANTHQAGPARIVTLSHDTARRNFTLGQLDSHYQMRFRTTETDVNGLPGLGRDNEDVVTIAAARSVDNDRAAVFIPQGTGVRIAVEKFTGDPQVEWVDPRTADWHDAAADADGFFQPPSQEDWVLVLR